MFNFAKLKLNKNNLSQQYTPFVGIRKNDQGIFEFTLPLGFENFPDNNFDFTKNIFFTMYRTFKKFETEHRNKFEDNSPKKKDTIQVAHNGYSFKDKNDDEVLLYSKIGIIDNILSTYDELAINTVIRTEGSSQNIVFERVEAYLDKAIYQEESIYIEEFITDRRTLSVNIHDIIELYSFILDELKKELQEEIDDDIISYSKIFREKHLGSESSLFNEKTYEQTIFILKDILDKIDKRTPYKDDGYWRIYTAIELFLYGDLNTSTTSNDGIFWGVNNFYQIWEDMCNTYAFKNFKNILYADTKISINGISVANRNIAGHLVYCSEDFSIPFCFSLNANKRYARPDFIHIPTSRKVDLGISFDEKPHPKNSSVLDIIVRLANPENQQSKKIFEKVIDMMISEGKKTPMRHKSPNIFKIYNKHIFEKIKRKIAYINENNRECIELLDWKYIDIKFLTDDKNQKVKIDITKQLFYEFSLQYTSKKINTNSSFILPYYYPEGYKEIGEFFTGFINQRLRDSKIKVFHANFIEMQKAYLNDKRK